MTRITSLLLMTACALACMESVNAQDRYRTPPAVVLSPDLTSPWVLQLKRSPAPRAQRKRTVRTTTRPKPVSRQVRTYRQPRTSETGTGIFALFNSQGLRSPAPSRRMVRRAPQTATQALAPARLETSQSRNQQATAYIRQQASERPIDPKYLPRIVNYETGQKPGSIIIDTNERFLYLVLEDGKARRYGVGVGKQGFEWSGSEKITRKAEWPSWRPPAEMIAREREKGRELPTFMEGGPANPLGARALYLGDTLYRIHGTNQPWTIGQAVSSGCIRMRNEDVMDLYERTRVGAKVIVT